MYSYVNKPTIIKYFTILKNMPIDFSELASDAIALENINKYIIWCYSFIENKFFEVRI